MARRVSVELVDDLDGKEASETVRFGLDGNNYEIDLNERNAEKLRTSLARYIDVARKANTGKAGRRGTKLLPGTSAADIRAWAESQKLDVPARGRIPNSIREQYDAAH
jgi:hypothetical protein